MFERGKTQAEVVRKLGVSRQSASDWHRRWNKGGLDALRSTGKRGRKHLVTDAEMKKVERALLRGPVANGFANDLWTLERIGKVIAQITGVAYHQGHVWKILKRLGWSLQRPARRATERDEKAVLEWKPSTRKSKTATVWDRS